MKELILLSIALSISSILMTLAEGNLNFQVPSINIDVNRGAVTYADSKQPEVITLLHLTKDHELESNYNEHSIVSGIEKAITYLNNFGQLSGDHAPTILEAFLSFRDGLSQSWLTNGWDIIT